MYNLFQKPGGSLSVKVTYRHNNLAKLDKTWQIAKYVCQSLTALAKFRVNLPAFGTYVFH